MQPFTATLQLAGRSVTVRELSMPDFRKLLFAEEVAANEAAAEQSAQQAAPVADVAIDADPSGALTQLAENFMSGWLNRYLSEHGITPAFIPVMTSITLADLMHLRFSEVDTLISKIKALNAPFFELFHRLGEAAEPTREATTAAATTAPPPTPVPAPPPTNASASSDPLLHSLGMAIQTHGTTATPFLNPPLTNSSTH